MFCMTPLGDVKNDGALGARYGPVASPQIDLAPVTTQVMLGAFMRLSAEDFFRSIQAFQGNFGAIYMIL
jgi:hypothetical protein